MSNAIWAVKFKNWDIKYCLYHLPIQECLIFKTKTMDTREFLWETLNKLTK